MATSSTISSAPFSAKTRTGIIIYSIHLLVLISVFAAAGQLAALSADLRQTVLAMCFSSAIVLAGWSACLLLRALFRKEGRRWALVVLAAILIEANVYCISFWPELFSTSIVPVDQAVFWLGLPLFIPFFTLAVLVAFPLSACVSRWMERRALKRGKPAPSYRERIKRHAVCCATVILLAVIFVLPCPLFAYSAAIWTHHLERRWWTDDVFCNMPCCVTDRTMEIFEDSGDPDIRRVVSIVLSEGRVSEQELLQHAKDRDKFCSEQAFLGLCKVNPRGALHWAIRVSNTRVCNDDTAVTAAGIIAVYGSSEEIVVCLEPGVPKTAPFRASLIRMLTLEHRNSFSPNLFKFIQSNSSELDAKIEAARALCAWNSRG